jgi:hypothetical protein
MIEQPEDFGPIGLGTLPETTSAGKAWPVPESSSAISAVRVASAPDAAAESNC